MDIVTLTLNPCLDYTDWVNEFGETPRRRDMQTGGKGINVARVLSALGIGAAAVCPLGGKTGDIFRSLAASEGITLLATDVSSPTRIITTTVQERDFAQKVDYQRGDALTEDELDALEENLTCALDGAKVLAVCGSASCEAAAKRVPGIISRARSAGIKVLLDANGAALTLGAQALPDLIKPNEDELAALTGIKDDPSRAAAELLKTGIGAVLASLGSSGCMLAAPDTEEYCPAPKVETVNAVGSGDSFVAGFLYASLKGYAPQTALMLACAAGAANARMFPAARISRADIEELTGWKLA